ncbi:zinc finger protein 236-like [Pollicipes pollicipes]|uniref:zinc finger protein 236-like n=1 Tax=Pollicipes pollicipes TaxID=41117 RepID=UPI001884DFCC|nr:zinc finger protein 236-like [Pollicipes pollicipes]
MIGVIANGTAAKFSKIAERIWRDYGGPAVMASSTTDSEADGTSDRAAKSTIHPTVQGTTGPEAEGTSDRATEDTGGRTAKGTTNPAVEGTANPEAEGTSDRASEDTTISETETTSDLAAKGTTGPEAESTSDLTAEGTSDRVTENTTDPTVESTTDPEAEGTIEPTAKDTGDRLTDGAPDPETKDVTGRTSAPPAGSLVGAGRPGDRPPPDKASESGSEAESLTGRPLACDECNFRTSDADELCEHESQHRCTSWVGRVRYPGPNGLLVPQPPEPRRADRASTSPPPEFPRKQATAARAGEEPAEDAQDPWAGHIRRMKANGEFPCRLCDQVFPNLRAMKGHNRVHMSAAPYACNVCPFSSGDKTTLTRHMKDHNGERPYECRICKYAFTTKANCERHLKNRHQLKLREELADNMAITSTDGTLPPKLLATPLLHALPPPSAPSSSASGDPTPTPADEPLPLDLSKRPPEQAPAAKAPRMASPQQREDEQLKQLALTASQFGLYMPYAAAMPLLVMPSMLNYGMDESWRSSVGREMGRGLHLHSGGGILDPHAHMQALSSALSLAGQAHLQLPPPPESKEAAPEGVGGHAKLDQPGVDRPPLEEPPRTKPKQRRYRTQRPFACNHCEARFTLSTNMDRHVKNHHPDKWERKTRGGRRSAPGTGAASPPPPPADEPDGPLVIDESAPARRDEDLASVSRLVDLAQAQTCQQYFRSDEESSDGSERAERASWPSGDDEPERRRSAYSSAPNKIPCRVCKREFPWTSSLRRHELTHSGEKPYRCPHCPVHFTTKSNCDRHLVRKHSGGTDSGGSGVNCGGGSGGGAPPAGAERPFKCSLCPSATFSTQENLVRHHALKHAPGAAGAASQHQFWCHICGRRFFELDAAKDHLEAEHEQAWAELERCNARWVSQIAEEDQGLDKIFCVVCLVGFSTAEVLGRHMATEHLPTADDADGGADGEGRTDQTEPTIGSLGNAGQELPNAVGGRGSTGQKEKSAEVDGYMIAVSTHGEQSAPEQNGVTDGNDESTDDGRSSGV